MCGFEGDIISNRKILRNRLYSPYKPYKEGQKSHVRLYAMFARNLKTGELFGFCNDSFCMSWRKDCVRVWNEVPTHYYVRKVRPGWDRFVVRLNSKNCPVIVDLSTKAHTFKGNYLFREKTKDVPEEKVKYPFEHILE